MQKRPSAIFSGSSASRLFVPQLITTYSSDYGRGMFSALHNVLNLVATNSTVYCIFIKELIPDVGVSQETCNNGVSKQNSGYVSERFDECCLVFMIHDPIVLVEMTSRVCNSERRQLFRDSRTFTSVSEDTCIHATSRIRSYGFVLFLQFLRSSAKLLALFIYKLICESM